MAIAVIIHSNKVLKSYLDKLKIEHDNRNKCIIFGERDFHSIHLLEEKGFQEIAHLTYDSLFRNRFLQEYIDLIGHMGKDYNSQKWWATDIASKNRFASKVPFLLHQFLAAVQAIEKEDFDNLIILNPSWVILNCLKEVLRKKNLRFVCIENHYPKWKELGFGRCRIILLAVYNTLIIIRRRYYVQKKLRHVIRKRLSRSNLHYVIKTFIYDHSFSETGTYRDVFFGSLLDHLREKRQVFIYGNILGNFKLCIHKISQCTSHVIFPIEAFLSPIHLLNALVQFLFYKVRIKKEVLFFGYDVSNIINHELLRTYNGIDFYQFLHYWSTKKLLQTVPVETFLLTYENNPWEKMCMMAVREYSPGTKIIGYQHTVVPQASANMFVSENEKDVIPMPDRILTVGEAPKDIMERYGSYENGKIEPSCGLRFEYLSDLRVGKRKRSGHILVVLEGIFEVYKLVNYVLAELKGSEEHQIVVRTHPVLPLKHFAHKLLYPLDQIKNFRLSGNLSLKDDIEWADMAIYWGSTVALEALSMGKPVIHFEMDSVLSYDPLFECHHLKWVVSEKSRLRNTINEIYSIDDGQFVDEQMRAKEYLNRYFLPVTESGLNKFLN